MDVILLGAGRPAGGAKPSALKNVGLNTKAIDWQLRTLKSVNETAHLKYIGGYHVEDVISGYPHLAFTVVPDWEQQSILHTLLQAPFSKQDTLVTYTDTVFRKEAIQALVDSKAAVSFGIDCNWVSRYQPRSAQDIARAETINLEEFERARKGKAEFTGLLHLKAPVIEHLSTLKESDVGSNLIDLIHYLRDQGFSVAPVDISGSWAEFNSSADIARFILGTKAETLARLEPVLTNGHIGKQVSFTTTEWNNSRGGPLARIKEIFKGSLLVVRSSAKAEDNWHSSNAGGFDSVLNVQGDNTESIVQAVEKVIQSYGSKSCAEDQILVQEQVRDVRCSGVVLTCSLETGAPYYCFNFDDKTQSTESVTGGSGADLRTINIARSQPHSLEEIEPQLVPVLHAVQELEAILEFGRLDIEFAVDKSGRVHVFQVRPITVNHDSFEVEDGACLESLEANREYFQSRQAASPFICGSRNIFSNMSDWNPAEIVGIRPKPFALSLYRRLITNEVWAQQRAEFGYRDVRPQPLISTFSGQPYVDVRASLNSFIPAKLDETQAEELASAYLEILVSSPHAHDKIEFEVAFTTWTPSFLEEAQARLLPHGVSLETIECLENELKSITCDALQRLEDDIAPIQRLSQRRRAIRNSKMSPVARVYALLDDCGRYGTLPFSHAARAGFIATSFLKSLGAMGVFTHERHAAFMQSVYTVASEFQNDKFACAQGKLSQDSLIERYGHLRPGTYEISAQAYWENPDLYLSLEGASPAPHGEKFVLKKEETHALEKMLLQLGSNHSPSSFMDYLKRATQAREGVKFEFTKSLSRALDVGVEMGVELGLSRDEMSYLEFADLEQLRLNISPLDALKKQIDLRKKRYGVTRLMQLPSVIVRDTDFCGFERPSSEPNFVTAKRVDAEILVMGDDESLDVRNRIVLVPQADPGFDWLFGRGIAGLITIYGGANSHMAIRAAEMGLPAAIGVGEKLYESFSRMNKVQLDCANRIIRELQ